MWTLSLTSSLPGQDWKKVESEMGSVRYSYVPLTSNLSVHVSALMSDSKATRVCVFTNSHVRVYVRASTCERTHACDVSQTLAHSQN